MLYLSLYVSVTIISFLPLLSLSHLPTTYHRRFSLARLTPARSFTCCCSQAFCGADTFRISVGTDSVVGLGLKNRPSRLSRVGFLNHPFTSLHPLFLSSKLLALGPNLGSYLHTLAHTRKGYNIPAAERVLVAKALTISRLVWTSMSY